MGTKTMSGGQRSAVLGQDGNALWEKSEISDIAYCLVICSSSNN